MSTKPVTLSAGAEKCIEAMHLDVSQAEAVRTCVANYTNSDTMSWVWYCVKEWFASLIGDNDWTKAQRLIGGKALQKAHELNKKGNLVTEKANQLARTLLDACCQAQVLQLDASRVNTQEHDVIKEMVRFEGPYDTSEVTIRKRVPAGEGSATYTVVEPNLEKAYALRKELLEKGIEARIT